MERTAGFEKKIYVTPGGARIAKEELKISNNKAQRRRLNKYKAEEMMSESELARVDRQNRIKMIFPPIAAIIAFLLAGFVPNSALHPAADAPFYSYTMLILLGLFTVLMAVGQAVPRFRKVYAPKAPFYAGLIGATIAINILTAKTAVLPVLYFPSLDRIFGVLITDIAFIGKCLGYSLRLLLIGWGCGAGAGILTGIAIGFNKHARYWVQPLVRFLGPIPSTAWIPIVLVLFPTVISASSFLIAIAVWFPTTILTASGIQGIQKSYFEAAATLGASGRYTILKVGIPAAMPNMFIGLFNGTTASFITLVTAEMLGAKYGIGWYINWQKDMMSYSNVYAGLIVMSITCYLFITIMFRIRDKVLTWQKGVIKW